MDTMFLFIEPVIINFIGGAALLAIAAIISLLWRSVGSKAEEADVKDDRKNLIVVLAALKAELKLDITALKVEVLAATLLANAAVTPAAMNREMTAVAEKASDRNLRSTEDIRDLKALITATAAEIPKLREEIYKVREIIDGLPSDVRELKAEYRSRKSEGGGMK